MHIHLVVRGPFSKLLLNVWHYMGFQPQYRGEVDTSNCGMFAFGAWSRLRARATPTWLAIEVTPYRSKASYSLEVLIDPWFDARKAEITSLRSCGRALSGTCIFTLPPMAALPGELLLRRHGSRGYWFARAISPWHGDPQEGILKSMFGELPDLLQRGTILIGWTRQMYPTDMILAKLIFNR